MNGKALLSGIILVGNVIGVAHAGQFDQVPKPTLVAGSSPGASSSGVRHGGEGAEKSSLTVTPDYIMGPEDVLEITVWNNAVIFCYNGSSEYWLSHSYSVDEYI